MNEFTAEKYIDKILSLYPGSEREETKLRAGSVMFNEAFGKYSWSDIEHALEWFYKNRSDKSRPTSAQLKDVLVELGIADRDGVVAHKENPFARPTTRLWSIKEPFDQLVDILMHAGVIPDENGNYDNSRSIVDPATDLPVLCVMRWLGWKLADAKRVNPDLFARYPHANVLEQLAIAVYNRLIVFKIRDWSKLVAAKRSGGNIEGL